MNSLDAQCLFFHLAAADGIVPPDGWAHGRDGTLSWRFGDRPSFTWASDDLAEPAARWRALGVAVPEEIAQLVSGHRAFLRLLERDHLELPDVIAHDIKRGELLAFWEDEKLAVIVGDEESVDYVPAS